MAVLRRVAGWAALPWRRARVRGAIVVIAVLVAAGTLAAVGSSGYSARKPRLLSGAAWLASSAVGQVTLLDGVSAEVAAQVQVAPRGNRLEVVQQGANAYAVNRATGQLRRVDGATFEVTPPVAPIPDAGEGLEVHAGADRLYALDVRRGVLTAAEPRELTGRGALLPLAAQVTPQAAVLDSGGRFWILDTATGDLNWLDRNERHTRHDAARAGGASDTFLTLAGGNPVLVDLREHTAKTLDRQTGRPRSTTALDLRPGDRVQVAGAPDAQRLHVAAARGVLIVCDLAAESCSTAVTLGGPDADLGIPVETGGRVFVPDYGTGRVWIVDLAESKVVAKPQVVDPKIRFQLLARDGVVFFNDPDSEHAGIIRLDGGVRQVPKYDPKDPDKGLSHPEPARSPSPNPSPSPSPSNAPSQQPSTPPSSTSPPAPRPTTSSKPPVTPSVPPPDRTVRISVSKTVATVNEDVTFNVTANAGPAPTSAHWDFGDGQSTEGFLATHRWSAVQTYQVSVRATFPSGQVASASLAITVVAAPPPPVVVPNVVGVTSANASATLTGLGLSVRTTQAASNTVPAGVVMAQAPVAGASVAAGSQVTVTVSTGKRAPFLLINAAPNAAWTTGAGTVPFPGPAGDPRGGAVVQSGFLLEDGSAPVHLVTHPEWVANGWINGVFTLPGPIIAGDHFRVRIGFVKPCCNVSAGDVNFVVRVRRSGTWVEVGRKHDIGRDGILYDLDLDLSSMQGATAIMLRAEAGVDAGQDWAAWVGPRVEG